MADDIIDRLLRIQEQDLQITDKERELEALPQRGKEMESQLDSYRAAIAAAEADRKAAQLEVSQIELDIEDHRQKLLRLREQQMALKTNREFRAMEEEIAVAQLKIEQQETRLLESMEKVDTLGSEIADRKTALSQAAETLEKEKAALASRASELERELEDLRHQRKTIAETVPASWLTAYDRLFQGKRDSVLVSVENGICGGCHMKLPPAVSHAARRADSWVACDFCGRMLYLPERMTQVVS